MVNEGFFLKKKKSLAVCPQWDYLAFFTMMPADRPHTVSTNIARNTQQLVKIPSYILHTVSLFQVRYG